MLEPIHGAWGWLDSAIHLVAANPEWALAITFLAAIIEAMAIIGTVVPGTFIVMGIAGAAAAGGQSMLPYLAVSVVGAVIGDFFSYWLGFHFRFRVRRWWPL